MKTVSGAVTDHGGPWIGAYGLRLTGIETAARYLVDAPASWPELAVERDDGARSIVHYVMEDDWAEYGVHEHGCVRLDREPLTARLTVPGGFSDDEMVHPGLAMLAAITNRWLGRHSFHAGAFLSGAGAWGVMGAKEVGKSTTLGYLASKGMGIISDDVLVVDGGDVLAGPRCVDLRASAADWLGQGVDIGIVGARRRWRMHLPPVPAAVPLQGWIVPSWGERVELEVVPPAQRMSLLYANLALMCVPHDPAGLLRLAALPYLILRRPRRLETMEQAVAMLLNRIEV